jgi:hypothetical protein
MAAKARASGATACFMAGCFLRCWLNYRLPREAGIQKVSKLVTENVIHGEGERTLKGKLERFP